MSNDKTTLNGVQWKPSCCMRKDRQTDRQTYITKLIDIFGNIANVPNDNSHIHTLTPNDL
jgi:hypothetical protein